MSSALLAMIELADGLAALVSDVVDARVAAGALAMALGRVCGARGVALGPVLAVARVAAEEASPERTAPVPDSERFPS